jgi:hypothetical protein
MKKHVPVVIAFILGSLMSATFAFADAANQPHMAAALTALTTAQTELNAAEKDKGGHREKALELVNKAIEQVNKGINFADKHDDAPKK